MSTIESSIQVTPTGSKLIITVTVGTTIIRRSIPTQVPASEMAALLEDLSAAVTNTHLELAEQLTAREEAVEQKQRADEFQAVREQAEAARQERMAKWPDGVPYGAEDSVTES